MKTAKSNTLQIHFPIKLPSVRKEKKMFEFHQAISFSYSIWLQTFLVEAFLEYRGIRGKKYFPDHQTANAIQ